jgi:prefoldin subunit 5
MPQAYGPAVAPQPTSDQELQWLRQEAQAMQQGLVNIEQRISELEQAGSDDA